MGQWLEHHSGITVVVGSIPTWNSEIFSLVSSPVAKQPSLHAISLSSHNVEMLQKGILYLE